MSLSRILTAALIAVAFSIAGETTASAYVVWCVADPPVQVVTPGGENLTVNNMIYIPRSALHLAKHFPASATAAADGHGGTLITVHVQVAWGVSSAHVVSSENRYRVSSPGDGTGGMVVTTYLDVPLA